MIYLQRANGNISKLGYVQITLNQNASYTDYNFGEKPQTYLHISGQAFFAHFGKKHEAKYRNKMNITLRREIT
jgi:hypothetical protein